MTVPIQLTRLAWEKMRQFKTASGVIINISSIGSAMNADHAQYIPIYSSSKAGLDQFTRAIAVPALVTDNIRVYTINPGVVDTDMGHGVIHSRFPYDTLHEFADAYNINGVPAVPDDVAFLTLELVLDHRHDIAPGQAIACFGDGQTACMSILASQSHISSLTGMKSPELQPFNPKLLFEKTLK